jgi:hypothetical protein
MSRSPRALKTTRDDPDDYALSLDAHDAALRAEQVDELVQVLNDTEGFLDTAAKLRFTSAITLLLELAPKLREATSSVASALSAPPRRHRGAHRRRRQTTTRSRPRTGGLGGSSDETPTEKGSVRHG